MPLTSKALLIQAQAAKAGDPVAMARVREIIEDAFQAQGGNRDAVARQLGVSDTTIDYWLLPVGTNARALGLEDLAIKYPRKNGRRQQRTHTDPLK